MSEKRNGEEINKEAKVAKTEDYKTNVDFKLMLINNPVESLAYHKKDGILFVVERSDNIVEVFKGLTQHNFMSAPVIQKTKHKWYGFIDVLDIVSFFVENFSEKEILEHDNMEELMKKKASFAQMKVNDLMQHPSARKVSFHAIHTGYSLFSAIETLARERALHRVAIVDDQRNLKSILTQSQVIEFIHKNVNMLGSIKDKPLKNCKNLIKQVIQVKESDKAIDAFTLMKKENVTGVAVVNDNGELTGNLSLKDLKAIRTKAELFKRLYQTANHFILRLRDEVYFNKLERPNKNQFVHETDTLHDALEVLVSHNIHRVYILSPEKKPIGVATLRDILLEVISN